MSNHQLRPLEINPKTGEPFLRLRDHKNIILTPPRLEDAPGFIPLMNDPRVYNWMSGPPLPYTMEHANTWAEMTKQQSDEIFKHLDEAKEDPELIAAGGCPVRCIREVNEDGTDTFIGDIGIVRCMYGELMTADGAADWENKQLRQDENNSLEIGDPKILWSIGDYVAPSHHGRGIMTDVVGTVMREWAIPRMGARRIWANVFRGNEGSVKVFLKNGFSVVRTYADHVSSRGKVHDVHLLEWNYEG